MQAGLTSRCICLSVDVSIQEIISRSQILGRLPPYTASFSVWVVAHLLLGCLVLGRRHTLPWPGCGGRPHRLAASSVHCRRRSGSLAGRWRCRWRLGLALQAHQTSAQDAVLTAMLTRPLKATPATSNNPNPKCLRQQQGVLQCDILLLEQSAHRGQERAGTILPCRHCGRTAPQGGPACGRRR